MAAEKRLEFWSEEYVERPSPLSRPHDVGCCHEHAVYIGVFVPIRQDGDKSVIDQGTDLPIPVTLEHLLLAPIRGRKSNRKKDRTVRLGGL